MKKQTDLPGHKVNLNFEAIYEDSDLLIANKPAGLLTIPDRFDKTIPNLKDLLEKKYEKIFVCHRLDKETSGVVVFAKNAGAHRFINEEMTAFRPKKIYHAICEGNFYKDELLIDIPLMTNPGRQKGMMPSARGKEAYTKVKVLKRFKNATLLECELLTGRQHQIRVHLQAIGYPLLVDSRYGNSEAFYLSSVKKKYNEAKGKEERPIISRVSLHSRFLEINHPDEKNIVSVEAEYPKDFRVLVKQLEKFAPMPEYYALGNNFDSPF